MSSPRQSTLCGIAFGILSISPMSAVITETDDFNSGSSNSSLWSSISSGTIRGAGEPGFNGSNALWFGGSGTRSATTQSFDTSAGATLSFRFRSGNSYIGAGPRTLWEQSDPYEAVVVEYSHHDGPWRTLRYYRSWEAATYGSWNLMSINLPAVALSKAARYRFRQTYHHSIGWDHWAIDDVSLAIEVPAGTSWSQALPGDIAPELLRLNPSGGVELLFTATQAFTLGSHSGSAGTYLASSAADGSWTRLTALNTTGALIREMAVDTSGNIILCGAYTGTPLGLASNSITSGFVVKLNSSHQIQWSRTGWNLANKGAEFSGLSVDGSGNITVAGTYQLFMRFGPNGNIGEPELNSTTSANPAGEQDATLLARFDASGNYIWSRRVGDGEYTDPEKIHGLHQDSSGNLYLFGYYNSQESLGNVLTVSPLAALDGPDSGSQQLGYVVKFDSAGNPQWASNLGWSSDLRDIASQGSILYATGTYGGGGIPFSPQGTEVPEYGDPDSAADDLFLVRIDPTTANVTWVRTAGPYCATWFGNECLRTDASGNAYWLHQYNQDHSINGTTDVTDWNTFGKVLSRWDSDGNLSWHKRAKMGSRTMATDTIGQTYVAGMVGDLAVFESSATYESIFLHKFNNVFEATKPAATDIIRSSIPSNWPGGTDLGPLIAVDTDGAGTYSYSLVNGEGDEHNELFQIDGSGNLLLANDALLVEGDTLNCRVRVTDENSKQAESVLEFTVIQPDYGQWAVPIEGGANILQVRATADGGMIAGGRFSGTITAGGLSDTALGSSDWFALKLDADGTPLWLVTGGNTGYDQLGAIHCGSDGLIHLACEVSPGTQNFTMKRNGGSMHQSVAGLNYGGGRDLCIVSLDSNGGMRWVSRMGGTYNDYPHGIAYDPVTGRCVVTGQFSGNLHTEHYLSRIISLGQGAGGLVGGTLISARGGDSSTNGEVFVLSYDQYGNREWVKRGGSNRTSSPVDYGSDVAFDGSGNVVVIGSCAGSAEFGGYFVSGGGNGSSIAYNHNAFLWKLNSSGSTSWARSGGTYNHPDEGLRVGIDGSGNIRAAIRIFGYSSDTATFSPLNITPSGSGDYDVVVVRYNSAGTPQDYLQFGDHPSAGFKASQYLVGFRVYQSGEMMVGAPCTGINGTYINPTGYHHYFDASGTRQWSGTVWGPTHFDYTGDLIPMASGTASLNQEVYGVILPAGPYVTLLEGPTPVRAAPTGITLNAPAPIPAEDLLKGSAYLEAEGILGVDENQAIGTVVAVIGATDTDSTDFTYQLIGGTGSDGNPAFAISGSNLVTAQALNYEEIASYSVRLRAIDESGQAVEQSFTINVNDLPDSLTPAFTITDLDHVQDGQAHGATVSVEPYGLPFTVTYDGIGTEPSAAGAYAVVVSPNHPDYAGDGSATLWIRDAFMQWIAANIDSAVANDPAQEATGWGQNADFDGDGVINLLEYYHGANPSNMDRIATAVTPTSPIAGGMQFEWIRLKSGPTAQLQWSPNLGDWFASGQGPDSTTGTFTLEVIEDLGSNERVRASLSAPDHSRAFMRIDLSNP
ncbi:MAG: MBG domain-containing protein [Luteolibacter sp.]